MKGLVLIAPHLFTEPPGLASIAEARRAYETGDLRAKLAKYHAHVDSAFLGWNGAWLDPGFKAWNIEEFVDRWRAPALLIQGADDQYGTLAQVRAIEARSPAPVDGPDPRRMPAFAASRAARGDARRGGRILQNRAIRRAWMRRGSGSRLRPDQHRVGPVEIRKQPLQGLDLRQVVEHDVRIGRVLRQEILMISLGADRRSCRFRWSSRSGAEGMRGIELGDIGLRHPRLFGVRREDRRAILRPLVRPLAVELGRIVGDGEEDLQDLAVADLVRVDR